MYDDAADILEAPTTIGRMFFDPLNGIMHARVQAASTAAESTTFKANS